MSRAGFRRRYWFIEQQGSCRCDQPGKPGKPRCRFGTESKESSGRAGPAEGCATNAAHPDVDLPASRPWRGPGQPCTTCPLHTSCGPRCGAIDHAGICRTSLRLSRRKAGGAQDVPCLSAEVWRVCGLVLADPVQDRFSHSGFPKCVHRAKRVHQPHLFNRLAFCLAQTRRAEDQGQPLGAGHRHIDAVQREQELHPSGSFLGR